MGILWIPNTKFNNHEQISNHRGLSQLSLANCPLAKLPKQFGDFTRITNLILSGSNVEDFSAIANLTKLERLHLSRTKITQIDGLEEFEGLTSLDVSHSEIKGTLTFAEANLDNLNIRNTQIKKIEVAEKGFSGVRNLDARSSDLTDVLPLMPLMRRSNILKWNISNSKVESKIVAKLLEKVGQFRELTISENQMPEGFSEEIENNKIKVVKNK
jgi:Leucine-rich repeat (LRR) protein